MNIKDRFDFEIGRVDLTPIDTSKYVGDYCFTEFIGIPDGLEVIDTEINGISVKVSKIGVFIFRGTLLSLTNRLYRNSCFKSCSNFIEWDNSLGKSGSLVFTRNCLISDLLVAQTILGDEWLMNKYIHMFSNSENFDYYKYFYTESSKDECVISNYIPEDLFEGYLGRIKVNENLIALQDVNEDNMVSSIIALYNKLSEDDKINFLSKIGVGTVDKLALNLLNSLL